MRSSSGFQRSSSTRWARTPHLRLPAGCPLPRTWPSRATRPSPIPTAVSWRRWGTQKASLPPPSPSIPAASKRRGHRRSASSSTQPDRPVSSHSFPPGCSGRCTRTTTCAGAGREASLASHREMRRCARRARLRHARLATLRHLARRRDRPRPRGAPRGRRLRRAARRPPRRHGGRRGNRGQPASGAGFGRPTVPGHPHGHPPPRPPVEKRQDPHQICAPGRPGRNRRSPPRPHASRRCPPAERHPRSAAPTVHPRRRRTTPPPRCGGVRRGRDRASATRTRRRSPPARPAGWCGTSSTGFARRAPC